MQLSPGDDYGMMREVLTRRFKRLLDEAPRALPSPTEPRLAYPPIVRKSDNHLRAASEP